MSEQNTINGNNTSTRAETIISSSNTNKKDQSMRNTESNRKNKGNSKPIFVAAISVLVTLLLCVGAYYLFLKPKDESQGEEVKIGYATPDNDGTKTEEETITEFDDKISSTSSTEEKLNLIMNKAGYYIIIEDYNSAIAALDTIDVSTLSDFDQQRVYNRYATAFEKLGDTAKSDQYRQLADEASARDLGNQE